MTVLILAVAAYFGVPAVEAYARYYRFRDAMQQELRFAGQTSDAAIQRHLAAFADSIALPPAAQLVQVRRSDRNISVSSRYSEWIDLPMGARELPFAPHAEGAF